MQTDNLTELSLEELQQKEKQLKVELDSMRKDLEKVQRDFDNAEIKPSFSEEEKSILDGLDDIFKKQEELEQVFRVIEKRLMQNLSDSF